MKIAAQQKLDARMIYDILKGAPDAREKGEFAGCRQIRWFPDLDATGGYYPLDVDVLPNKIFGKARERILPMQGSEIYELEHRLPTAILLAKKPPNSYEAHASPGAQKEFPYEAGMFMKTKDRSTLCPKIKTPICPNFNAFCRILVEIEGQSAASCAFLTCFGRPLARIQTGVAPVSRLPLFSHFDAAMGEFGAPTRSPL